MNATAEMIEQSLGKLLGEHLGTEKLGAIVDERLNEKFKELNIGKLERKHGVFPGMSDQEIDRTTKKERIGQFIKAVFRKDMQALVEMKAMSEGSDADGGFLVPEEFMDEVARIMENYGLIRKLSRQIPMSTATLNFPTLGTAPTVYWPGEASNATESSPALTNVKMEAKTMVGLTVASNEFLADSSVAVVDWLTELFAEQMAGEEDNQGFNGTGVPFTGIFNTTGVGAVTAAAGHNTFATVDLDDYRDVISQIPSTALPKCVWIFHRSVWGTIQKLKDNSTHVVSLNNPIASLKPEGGFLTPTGILWGYPVYTSDKLTSTSGASTKFGIFGNFDFFFLGDRQKDQMAISQDATVGSTNLFQSNQQALRLTRRVSLNVGVPSAFATISTAS